MPQRRMNLEIESSADGREIYIGAFARKRQQRRRLFGWFGIGLMALAALLYFGLKPISETGRDRPIIPMRCSSCGKDTSMAVPPETVFPLKCPQCEQRTLQAVWQCRRCNERFLPGKASDIVRCPKCNSDAVGNAVEKTQKP